MPFLNSWMRVTHSFLLEMFRMLRGEQVGLQQYAAAKSLQSCLTLCDPIDGSPPGSPVPGILPGKNTGVGCHFLLQCMKVKVKLLSRVRLFTTPWTAAHQAPPSMAFSRQEYWSGVPLPSLLQQYSYLKIFTVMITLFFPPD